MAGTRKLRLGLIGGGPGAFIGPIHRIAAELDGRMTLVAGAFSSDPDRSRLGGERYGIDPARAYPDHATMLAAERARDDGIDLVAIVTPNHLHFPAAMAALAAGVAVISDKPATSTLAEARELAVAAARAGAGRPYALTYTYSGYPLVREARARIAEGLLGTVRRVAVEYVQGWLSAPMDEGASKQARWRLDPAQSGVGGCIGDIGVHAFHLAEFVTGLRVTRLCADLGTVVPDRALDDDVAVLLRFENGARGVLTASQVATGERNGLSIRVYGDRAGLVWRQEQPDHVVIMHADGRSETIWGGTAALGPHGQAASRTPGGHPEGYLEAFATLYRDFADVLHGGSAPLLPGIADGVRSMAFIEAAVTASRDDAGWILFEGQ
ncbi:MAG TPA: Gfo/Idh/MocA family oxidoreductase [Sphingomonas sp.]|jgi:predicted dehydrogenase|uniref:Gfo/Idh/MocA family protein n=1 Tax=Sphingomonas sp. TaxID=28214 RepID=UPI002EDB9437